MKKRTFELSLQLEPLRLVLACGGGRERELRLTGEQAQKLGSVLLLVGVRETERREAPAGSPRVFAASRGM